MKNYRIAAVVLAVLLVWGLHAADLKGPATGTELDAAMQEAMKQGAPGEHHKVLEPFAGRFATTSRIWMSPGEAPVESAGTSENTWVLGGRFLKMSNRGYMSGQAFEGIGYLGYDNIRGEYTGVWLDNMKTGITHSTGRFDPATRTYTEKGTFSCPMTGEKDMRYRAEWKVTDDDTLSYTMYHPGPDGNEVKAVQVSYTRVK